jgi:hypothetical protein
MRWLFYDSKNSSEARYHEETLDSIASWWTAFWGRRDDLAARLAGERRWDIPSWVRRNLKPIDLNLKWELAPGDDGRNRFTITPESRRELRPLVDEILLRAPIAPGWEFASSRAAASVETALGMVKQRVDLDLSRARVLVTAGEFRGVCLAIDLGLDEPCSREDGLTAAFLASEYLVGEELLDRWIERLAIENGLTSAHSVPLAEMHDRVQALVDALKEQRPRESFAERQEPQSSVVLRMPESHIRKLEERARGEEDFPRRTDILVATTPDPSLWNCAHSGRRFYSERYSRHGELFCYLKVDTAEGVLDTASVSTLLDESLRRAGLGCVIGSGEGQRYVYVDLALNAMRKGVQCMREALADADLPQRSWIQFFDSTLRGEWVGIYDNTPAPPR